MRLITFEKKKQKTRINVENASARLHDKVKARKDAEQRRAEAVETRQSLYESRKNMKFSGKKTTFSDSEEEPEEPKQKKSLFDGSDDEDLTLDLDDKLRDEHEGPEGGKLFQFEQANFGGDNRFQMGNEFKADLTEMKSTSDIVSHPKPEVTCFILYFVLILVRNEINSKPRPGSYPNERLKKKKLKN